MKWAGNNKLSLALWGAPRVHERGTVCVCVVSLCALFINDTHRTRATEIFAQRPAGARVVLERRRAGRALSMRSNKWSRTRWALRRLTRPAFVIIVIIIFDKLGPRSARLALASLGLQAAAASDVLEGQTPELGGRLAETHNLQQRGRHV